MIDKLRAICSQFPGVTEDIKWGADLCFCVGAKMFCVVGIEAPHNFSFKCSEENFEALTEREGVIPAPYMAKHLWVAVRKPSVLKKDELAQLLEESYTMVRNKLPKKVQEKLGK
ncbi:MmcQ/YjbR family DNA-binding protein [Chitinophaga sp. 22620]|uniref:MmcQ/YjbR family DNA-binding protein n=1 Tax=Chitinophaga sp. 22620 TaxID=3453952 RepID=UPI003F83A527